jgi:hypothetical protein
LSGRERVDRPPNRTTNLVDLTAPVCPVGRPSWVKIGLVAR